LIIIALTILMKSLIPVIKVDESKCLNCHACISACPVKYCNDGSGDVVHINHNLCIACGHCIPACTHDARTFIDDFNLFLNDLIAGQDIIAIVAPSAAAAFPDKYLNLNTFLKKLGVKAIFDVSFGAELAAKSYIDYISTEKPKTVIAQPCAAIVTYIELYQPELLKYLAPVDSPMLHTMKMVKKYYPLFKDCKIAILSPCNAKKREFEETGLGNYNIAQKSIDDFLKKENINLDELEKTDFDNPPAERAVMFSSPGGLLETIKRWIPDIEKSCRKIEGVPLVYNYLKSLPQMIDENKSPLLIDCLSCDYGCNGGPLTITKDKPQDEVEYWVKKRANELKEKYLSENENNNELSRNKIESILDKYWENELYKRTYVNNSQNVNINHPSKSELEGIYHQMHKYTSEDIKNCSSCGYNSCENMATAIKNNLNRAENCHYFLQHEAKSAYTNLEQTKQRFVNILDTMLAGYIEIDLDGTIVDVNPAMRHIFRKEDIIGRPFIDFIDIESQVEYKNQIKQRHLGKKSSYELLLTQSDGQKVPCLINATPKFDFETGKVIGSFAMVTDISELKKMQNELNELNQHLEEKIASRTQELTDAFEEIQQVNEEMQQQREEILAQRDSLADSEKRIRTILLSIPDAVFIINKDGKVTFWNSVMENLTGMKAEEMIGKADFEYAIPFYGRRRPMLIDFLKMDEEYLKKNYKNVKRKGSILQAESHALNLNGDYRYLVGIATAIYDNDDEYDGAMEVIRDETEKKENLQLLTFQKKELVKKQLELDDKIDELTATTEIVEAMNIDLQQQHFEIEAKNEILTVQTNEIIEKHKELIQQKEEILAINEKLEFQKTEIISQNLILEEQQIALTKQHNTLQKQNKDIKNSIEYAKRIQIAALKVTEDLPFKENFILFRPKDIVSGDFYFIKKFSYYTVVVSADCTGHGVPGAFMSLLGISLLNEITAKHFQKTNTSVEAAKILDDLRDNLIKTLNQSGDRDSTRDGMDMSICIYNERTKELQFSGAFSSIVLIRDNKLNHIKGDKMPIGFHFFKDSISQPFTNRIVKLMEGDCIYQYTDGYQDQFGGETDKKFLKRNFHKLLLAINKEPLETQKEILEQKIIDYQGNFHQTDDMLVIGIKI